MKGLRGKELQEQIDVLLKVLNLKKYKHRRAGTYSGGNKRKLSVAMSMIGNPPIVFLDEPSWVCSFCVPLIIFLYFAKFSGNFITIE